MGSERFDEALSLVVEMSQAGWDVKLSHYSTPAGKWENVFQWEIALSSLDCIRSSGVIPNSPTCDIVLQICEVSRQWPDTLDLLDQMEVDGLSSDQIVNWRQKIARHKQTSQERWEEWRTQYQYAHENSFDRCGCSRV